ncbi:hypothetical protein [Bradyrhizobium sp. S3.7.6]
MIVVANGETYYCTKKPVAVSGGHKIVGRKWLMRARRWTRYTETVIVERYDIYQTEDDEK